MGGGWAGLKGCFWPGRGVCMGLLVAALGGLPAAAADPPSLSPGEGPAGTVVEVKGMDLTGTIAAWDADSPDSQDLPADLGASPFLTVPPGATPGTHAVQLIKGGKPVGAPLPFVVRAGVRPRPRLDDVTVYSFLIDGRGHASIVLMVHGANLDFGAEIVVDGVRRPTTFFRLYRNAGLTAAHDPTTLGYPISHYATLHATLRGQIPGSRLDVAVRNLDGRLSETRAFRLAYSAATLDSDGDGSPTSGRPRGMTTTTTA
jgi:hypothetical protein